MTESSLDPNYCITQRVMPQRDEVRVGSKTAVHELASAISGSYARGRGVTLLAIGTQAINQAIKAVVHVNGKEAHRGLMFCVLPFMEDVTITDDSGNAVERTVMKLLLTPYAF